MHANYDTIKTWYGTVVMKVDGPGVEWTVVIKQRECVDCSLSHICPIDVMIDVVVRYGDRSLRSGVGRQDCYHLTFVYTHLIYTHAYIWVTHWVTGSPGYMIQVSFVVVVETGWWIYTIWKWRATKKQGCSLQAVASPGFGARRGTKLRENNLGVIHKQSYEVHARPVPVLLFIRYGRQPHRVQCQSLCGSEVHDQKKIKQLEVERGHVPQCPIAI